MQMTKKHAKLPSMHGVIVLSLDLIWSQLFDTHSDGFPKDFVE